MYVCMYVLVWFPWFNLTPLWFTDGMGTAEWRAAKNPAYYKRGDYVPGLKVR